MPEETESDYQEWINDVEYLVKILKKSFNSTEASYNIDEMNETLYVELEGLDQYPDEEVIEIAEPIFDIIDLDFEDIILLPLKK